MKFYGSGTVWDSANNKRLCRFVNGEYETDNQRVIGLLIKAGYKADTVIEPVAEYCADEKPEYDNMTVLDDLTVIQLRELCKERDIPISGKNKAELIEVLKEGE